MKRRVMIGRKKQLFTKRFFPAGNYTWVVPPGCTEVDVFIVGAGGGTGRFIQSWGMCGGGGGGYTKTFKKDTIGWKDGEAVIVTPGQSISIVVGAGVSQSDGGYSQFLNSNYRADGGKGSNTYSKGGDGGSAGGNWLDPEHLHGRMPNGASDGNNNPYGSSYGLGQGHTTRDFGEPTGKRNAGGGATGGQNILPIAGISDYVDGSGDYHYEVNDAWRSANAGGGGYGGGASSQCNSNTSHNLKGGDGTVLIRYWAYRE